MEEATLGRHEGVVNHCAFAPDGQWAFSAGGTTVRLWDLKTNREAATFHVQAELREMKGNGGWNLAVGDEIGRVFLLRPERVTYGAALVTLVYLYRFGSRGWDEKPTAVCPWCGCRFEGDAKAIDAILSTRRESGLLPSDPQLVFECPGCARSLRFNPFIVDNRDRY
jgi:hypothetical protein